MTNATKTYASPVREAVVQQMQTGELSLTSLEELAQQVLAIPDIDFVYAACNADYHYELDVLFAIGCPQINTVDIDFIQLTSKELEALKSKYACVSTSDEPNAHISAAGLKSQLNAGIMSDGKYLGSIGFASLQERKWTEDECDLLDALKLAFLFYLGMKTLETCVSRDRRLSEKIGDEKILSWYHLNFETGMCYVEKIADFLKDVAREWMPYPALLDKYCEIYLDPMYGERLFNAFNIESLKESLSPASRRISIELPRLHNGNVSWLRCMAEALSFAKDGTPRHAAIIVRDITTEVQNEVIVTHDLTCDRNTYVVISGVNLDTEKYVVFIDNTQINENGNLLDDFGDYHGIMEHTVNYYVDEEYRALFREKFSTSRMREVFDADVAKISMEFTCSVEGNTFWISLEAVPTQTYSEANRMVIFYYSNISLEKEHELNLKQAQRSLEAERKRALQNERRLIVDPLTGAYNRIGYMQRIEQLRKQHEPIGYLMIDVDHFKELNDAFGHNAGDSALVEVVTKLKQAFRAEDMVFRMGGDEFVMILDNCNSNAWKSVRAKIAAIHESFRRQPEDFGTITISAGFVVSDNGYDDSLPRLADDALYNTKRNGRAGLTQFDLSGNIANSWNDRLSSTSKLKPLDELGKWHYTCPVDGSQTPKLYFDEAARFILGIPNSLSPEKCYELWAASLPERCLEMIADMQGKAAAIGQAEATHIWNHPKDGQLHIRTRVKSLCTDELLDFTGHFVVLKQDDMTVSFDDGQFVIQALSNAYLHSYYIDICSGSYTLMKGFDPNTGLSAGSIEAPLEAFVENEVHPDYQQRVRDFLDMKTVAARLENETFVDIEYLSVTKNGWCRSRLLPVKWNKTGKLTRVLLSSISIDESKRRELEHSKQVEDSLRLQLMIGEMISGAPLLQAGIIDRNNGAIRIWLNGIVLDNPMVFDFETSRAWGLRNVHPADRAAFQDEFVLERIVDAVDNEGSYTPTFRLVAKDGAVRTIMHHYGKLEGRPDMLLMAIEDVTDMSAENCKGFKQRKRALE